MWIEPIRNTRGHNRHPNSLSNEQSGSEYFSVYCPKAAVPVDRSCVAHTPGGGQNDMEACNQMPSRSAKARTASKPCNRSLSTGVAVIQPPVVHPSYPLLFGNSTSRPSASSWVRPPG